MNCNERPELANALRTGLSCRLKNFARRPSREIQSAAGLNYQVLLENILSLGVLRGKNGCGKGRMNDDTHDRCFENAARLPVTTATIWVRVCFLWSCPRVHTRRIRE